MSRQSFRRLRLQSRRVNITAIAVQFRAIPLPLEVPKHANYSRFISAEVDARITFKDVPERSARNAQGKSGKPKTLSADARAEHLLLAARKLGRERATLLSGMYIPPAPSAAQYFYPYPAAQTTAPPVPQTPSAPGPKASAASPTLLRIHIRSRVNRCNSSHPSLLLDLPPYQPRLQLHHNVDVGHKVPLPQRLLRPSRITTRTSASIETKINLLIGARRGKGRSRMTN